MKNLRFLLYAFILIALSSCAANKPYFSDPSIQDNVAERPTSIDPENIDYEVFLVGDLNLSKQNQSGVAMLNLIKNQLRSRNSNQSIVFLGNTIHEKGLSDEESSDFQFVDELLDHWIPTLRKQTDKLYFIPGNHEWTSGVNNSIENRKAIEQLVEEKANDKNIFVPSKGCGEPKVVELTDDLVLVMIDSPWLLQGDDSEERKRSGCDIDDELEFLTELKGVLSDYKRKNVVIASHHPLYTNGKTGGNYPASSHLLPLPVVGSIFTGMKKLFGSEQQFGHPNYEAYRSALLHALGNFEGVVTASAHEKNMQYTERNKNHFIVAGSASEVDFLQKGGETEFAYMERGFAKIMHTKNLELWIEFFEMDENDPTMAIPVFRKMIHKKEVINFADEDVYKGSEEYPKTVVKQASKLYEKRGNIRNKQYSEEWSTEVEVPVLLLDEVDGGLKPVQQGGGFSTLSLRLVNPEGRQYVLRTVDKDVTKVVPPPLRNTFAKELIQSGIASAHPYSALVVPKLADAAKIYHANPKYVWLPHQKALGEYNNDFAEKMFLFEERPGGNTDGHPTYGGTKETVNSLELVEKLFKNHKHQLDQQYVLRARLFDILLGDWDRHDDQWRWGTYSDPAQPGITIYRAIPRDRDQVFFRNNGILNFVPSRNWFNPQLRIFDDKVDNLKGLVNNARFFDRHFLNQMSEEDYINAAKDLQEWVTDDVIASAFQDWPEPINKIRGEETIAKLKQRRADLVTYAKEYYSHIAKDVTIPGTYEKDVFEISTLPGNKLDVKVFHLDKEDKHLIYQRTIDGSLTKEVRLFGLKKSDIFQFEGDEKSSIRVRIIGGSGEDQVVNQSSNLNIIAYDRLDGMKLTGQPVKSNMKDQDGINHYDRKDWALNKHFHFPMITFYTDEGIGFGYNVWWKKHGFRSKPYQSSHTLSANYFAANGAIIGKYDGHWPNAFGANWDFRLLADGKAPTFTQYFYGLGNEYINYEELFPTAENVDRARFHVVRGSDILLVPTIEHQLKRGRVLSFNPFVQFINLDEEYEKEDRFIYTPAANRVASDFDSKTYVGISIGFQTNRVNHPTMPTRGFQFNSEAKYRQSLSDAEFSNISLSTSLATYIPFDASDQVVLAVNFGGAYTFGDYEFFHANYLSNKSRMRGFRLNRFAGDGMVYAASDLRIKVFKGSGVFPTDIGIFGSFDIGRVFLKNENQDQLHSSFGGGIFLQPLNLLSFKAGYHIGQDDKQLIIGGSMAF
jgi:hypothetical protein